MNDTVFYLQHIATNSYTSFYKVFTLVYRPCNNDVFIPAPYFLPAQIPNRLVVSAPAAKIFFVVNKGIVYRKIKYHHIIAFYICAIPTGVWNFYSFCVTLAAAKWHRVMYKGHCKWRIWYS